MWRAADSGKGAQGVQASGRTRECPLVTATRPAAEQGRARELWQTMNG